MSIEALKLALEALERIDLWLKARYSGIGLVGVELEAITALRQAIEQAQKQEPVAWKDAMNVAFWRMYEHGKNNNTVSAQCEVQALWMLCDGEFDDITAWHPSQWKLPPQRQPLTDEQWQEIAALTGCLRIEKRGRDAIMQIFDEAAHGIKENNNG